MSERSEISAEVWTHAVVVAVLTAIAAFVDLSKDSDWVREHLPDILLRALLVVLAASVAFAVVLFIGKRLERNQRLAETAAKQNKIYAGPGELDGIWVDVVWDQAKTLVGASVFALESHVVSGFSLHGVFYLVTAGQLAHEPSGEFQGSGSLIGDFQLVYHYEGREGRPAINHTGTGYYRFTGMKTSKLLTCFGHFSIREIMQVRVLEGERRSLDPTQQIRTPQTHQWLSDFVRRQSAGPAPTETS